MCEWPKLRGEVLILAANETTGLWRVFGCGARRGFVVEGESRRRREYRSLRPRFSSTIHYFPYHDLSTFLSISQQGRISHLQNFLITFSSLIPSLDNRTKNNNRRACTSERLA